ncbi:MAG: hypothetical protein E7260_08745 [Lachnospiraceae bacterium]|nr:hypothetical protein [Lachnospiraceae bacterium]
MISLKIAEMNRFMGKLLKSEAFDSYLLKEGFLRTHMEYRFQGRVFAEYFDTEEREALQEEYVFWKEVKPVVFELIKGKKTPLAFTFTLLFPKDAVAEFLSRYSLLAGEDRPSLYLQIRFEHGMGHVVTGTARSTFTLDRSLEEAWDAEALRLMKLMEIAVEAE